MRTEQQKVNLTKWIGALRSGKYAQAQEVLKTKDPEAGCSYCCLGVACELFGWEHANDGDERMNGDAFEELFGFEEDYEIQETLISANDKAGKTFPEIAEALEQSLNNENTFEVFF